MKILSFDSPELHMGCERVTKFDRSLRELVREMFFTMAQERGCGLAANQVGILKQIIVAHHQGESVCLINPRVIKKSEEKIIGEEGCLSSIEDGEKIFLLRNKKIQVSYFNEFGKQKIKSFSNHWARIVQHEMDHLVGITMLDRLQASCIELKREKHPLLSVS